MPNSQGQNNATRNKLSNPAREEGASPPSSAVQEFDEGDSVHVVIDPSVPEGRPHPRFHGVTGVVRGEQGRAYEVEFEDGDMTKKQVVRPHHLQPQG